MAVSASDRGVVMLVDDNPDTLRMLIEALEDAGLTALVARDADAALALLDRIAPDVILMDAVMPGVDGFALCAIIKARPDCAAIPVVFMTGLSDSADIVRGLDAGGVDYLVKPINPEELIARIGVHVANARMIADARAALEATGDAVFAIGRDGGFRWTSAAAQTLLAAASPDDVRDWIDRNGPAPEWRAKAARSGLHAIEAVAVALPNDEAAQVSLIGRGANGDLILRLSRVEAGSATHDLADLFGLSERESDVLIWLARGKTNEDIATILQISSRTVSKHVENILAKLAVENRTAAAIKVVRAGF